MEKTDKIFYLIRGRIEGKKEDGKYYIFKDNAWVPDRDSLIMDRLVGYDPFEPEGSPYWCGSLSVMDEIEEIPAAHARELTGGNV